MKTLNDPRIDRLVAYHYSVDQKQGDDEQLVKDIIVPILKWTSYSRTSNVHAVLATILRDSNVHNHFERVLRHGDKDPDDVPSWLKDYSYYDKFELLPIGKAEIRRNFKKLFGIELQGLMIRSCLDRLCEAKLLVPVKNFYLINVPYIVRALTGYRYEDRNTEKELQDG